ncbi:class I SAM-dependent methyltransferase [Natronomonas gomsonensis]|uniref:class I SAM-dependent methyltransferase n=1 Tax=Natronomonas gomsonensis TaxID=1046043 RepID=UPI0015BD81F9|nr:class I SAM-dependent methyltransferase [Natronomonas gomsonensis]
MPVTEPFEEHTDRYDEWFQEYEHAYRSELAALERLVGDPGRGLEIGVGTGRFAVPLGIEVGVDPSTRMLERAAERGIEVIGGVAEALPFRSGTFDTALVVTTICFVDDIAETLREARRVLAPGGRLVVGYVDSESPLGERYEAKKADNPFYRDATFVSTAELLEAMESAGFGSFESVQTVFRMPEEMTEPDRVESGRGEGSFVGLAATAP